MQMDLVILSNQATPGICTELYEFGCTDVGGTVGNLNDLLSCYKNVGVELPFKIHALHFWFGRYVPIPNTLSLRIWSGSASGPGTILYEQPITPGPHPSFKSIILLDEHVEIYMRIVLCWPLLWSYR